MRPTSILHLIDDLNLGGAERVMATLVNLLPRQRFYPIVCSLENGIVADQLRKKGIEVIILPKCRAYDFVFLVKLIRLIRKKRIRLIHAHLLISHIYGWLASRLTRIPMIITIHGKSFMDWKHGNKVFRFVAKHSNKIITVSNNIKAEVIKRLTLSTDNFICIYNGVDLSKFQHKTSSETLKRNLNINSSDLIVGSVGGLRPVKDYPCLLKSIPIVLKEFPKTKFIIVGDGPLRNSLQSITRSLRLENNVLFLGWREDISELLTIFDIFVLSSKTEGISISILEAMASGLPVVATNVGGNPEVIEDGKTGFLVPQADSQSLAKAIIKLLKDGHLRKTMGKNARKKAEEKFSLQVSVDKHIEVYDRLLGY